MTTTANPVQLLSLGPGGCILGGGGGGTAGGAVFLRVHRGSAAIGQSRLEATGAGRGGWADGPRLI